MVYDYELQDLFAELQSKNNLFFLNDVEILSSRLHSQGVEITTANETVTVTDILPHDKIFVQLSDGREHFVTSVSKA